MGSDLFSEIDQNIRCAVADATKCASTRDTYELCPAGRDKSCACMNTNTHTHTFEIPS